MGIFNLFKSGGAKSEELKNIINDNAFLVDVRTPGEFSSGSAKGAVNIPLDQVGSKINKFNGKKNIVVFCKSGMRSAQAKAILNRNGVNNVTNGKTVSKVANLQN